MKILKAKFDFHFLFGLVWVLLVRQQKSKKWSATGFQHFNWQFSFLSSHSANMIYTSQCNLKITPGQKKLRLRILCFSYPLRELNNGKINHKIPFHRYFTYFYRLQKTNDRAKRASGYHGMWRISLWIIAFVQRLRCTLYLSIIACSCQELGINGKFSFWKVCIIDLGIWEVTFLTTWISHAIQKLWWWQ